VTNLSGYNSEVFKIFRSKVIRETNTQKFRIKAMVQTNLLAFLIFISLTTSMSALIIPNKACLANRGCEGDIIDLKTEVRIMF